MSVIYLDMDGVIADFFGEWANWEAVHHWKDIYNKRKSLAKLKQTDFFFRIKPFKDSEFLVDKVEQTAREFNVEWGICSSPLRGDRDNSTYWKRRWLEKHGWLPDVHNLIFTQNKAKYARVYHDGSPNILIDDKPSNIQEWEKSGGKGILYQGGVSELLSVEAKLKAFLSK